MTARQVAKRIERVAPLLRMNGGGVTFSGGEVMMQPDFVIAVRRLLPELHALIETSGFASEEIFRAVCSEMNMVIMDVKLVNAEAHKHYTGADNAVILRNLAWLKRSGIPFRIRIPLIPTVNDTEENLRATAELLQDAPTLETVELLRYNKAAGAKYAGLGMTFAPSYDESREPNADTTIFSEKGLPVRIL